MREKELIAMNEIDKDSLMHHGIKGQRWGVQNGPPYPLESSTKKRIDKGYKTVKELSEEQMKTYNRARKYGVFGALIAYAVDRARNKKKDVIDYRKIEGKNQNKLSDLRKNDKQMTSEENAKVTNPNSHLRGGSSNCGNCVVAMEMRERGYDVQARRNDVGCRTALEYKDVFDGFNIKNYTYSKDNEILPENQTKEYSRRAYSEFENHLLSSYEDGARGYVSWSYRDSDHESGHAVNWKIEDRQVKVYDAQNSNHEPESSNWIRDYSDGWYHYERLDNLSVNDNVTNFVMNWEGDDTRVAKRGY